MPRLKQQLVNILSEIPDLEHRLWPERKDGFSSLHFRGKEIGHFHNFNELDLRLGKLQIKSQNLEHHSDSLYHPDRKKGSQYIELRFHKKSDLARIVQLIQLALNDLKQ